METPYYALNVVHQLFHLELQQLPLQPNVPDAVQIRQALLAITGGVSSRVTTVLFIGIWIAWILH